MKSEQLYPKTIEDLFLKLKFIIENEQNAEKISKILNWIEWFNKQKYSLKYNLNTNEFLKAYFKENKFALQVWKHEETIDSIMFNLIANFYSEYDNENTIITNIEQ